MNARQWANAWARIEATEGFDNAWSAIQQSVVDAAEVDLPELTKAVQMCGQALFSRRGKAQLIARLEHDLRAASAGDPTIPFRESAQITRLQAELDEWQNKVRARSEQMEEAHTLLARRGTLRKEHDRLVREATELNNRLTRAAQCLKSISNG